MLSQFVFSNYKSFREEALLDFTADAIQEHQESLHHVEGDSETLLPVLCIYGPNGSGKSTALDALNSEVFRRDEVWFCAKGADNSSQLYSLKSIKKPNGKSPRKDEVYSKQYLEGRYGADPYIRRILHWEDES